MLEPLKSGWLVQGPKVNEFEDKWSEFTDTSHSVAVSSCTSAMHLSLAAMGFGVGDEAIVPAFLGYLLLMWLSILVEKLFFAI